ncbi:MAG: hypothetical protein ACREQV_21095, partial [Candidatus Binatia bacterium]
MGDRKTIRDLRNQVRPPRLTQALLQKKRDGITFLGDFVNEDDPDIPFGVTIEQIPTHEPGGLNDNLSHEQIDDELGVKQLM